MSRSPVPARRAGQHHRCGISATASDEAATEGRQRLLTALLADPVTAKLLVAFRRSVIASNFKGRGAKRATKRLLLFPIGNMSRD